MTAKTPAPADPAREMDSSAHRAAERAPVLDPPPPSVPFGPKLPGGEMGVRLGAVDWEKTALGPIASWDKSLLNYVTMIAELPSPAIIFWGEDQTQIYNTGYSMIMGPRHPRYFGAPYRECWPDTYPLIYPWMRKVLDHAEVIRVVNELIPVTRYGFNEETYFSFTFSPLRDDRGAVNGIIQFITEVTDAVLGERRADSLRALTPRAESLDPTKDATLALSASPKDIPFFLLYTWDDQAKTLDLTARSENLSAHTASLPDIAAAARRAFDADAPLELSDAVPWVGRMPAGPWPEPVRCAWILPLGRSTSESLRGVVVFGVSPRLRFDDKYRSFLEVVAGQVTTALTTTHALRDAQRRAEALAEIDRAKTAFFSNVSHELRTPLTLLIGPVEEMMADARVAPEQRVLLGMVDRNAMRLLRLVNTLLDFSRIEAGRADAAYEPTDLGAYTADLASAFRAAVEKADLRFVVDCPTLAEPAYVDRTMWEKIVLNLLSNALKHTFEGEIAVSLRAEGERVVLAVRDTGVGIPAAELPHLFERFHRVRGARSRTHEGTGIGLALVQELVKLHGGEVIVESAVGAGTTFSVSIPRGAAHLPQNRIGARAATSTGGRALYSHAEEALGWMRTSAAPEAPGAGDAERGRDAPGAPDVRAGTAPGRVLLADDNADMRDYVARLLRQRGDEVEAVADGQVALDAARRIPPDLILSDVMMPNLDGFALLRALRDDPRTRGVPVILLSARAGEEARVEGLGAGADDYLVKPFSARELLARVGSALALARLRAEAAREREVLIRSLERSNQDLDQFAYVASHDLKAPLRGIANLSQWLEEDLGDRITDDGRKQLALLRGRVHRLEALIEGILSYSRAGRVRHKPEVVDTRALLAEVIELLAPRSPAAVVVGPGMPTVEAERVPLQQVFMNLIGNGLKYAGRPDARVTVAVRDEGTYWEFSVADNGPGIAPEYHARIWGIFQTLAARDKVEGAGIGLSVVQKIVETRGGRAWVDSAEGHGAKFYFTWPKGAPEAR